MSKSRRIWLTAAGTLALLIVFGSMVNAITTGRIGTVAHRQYFPSEDLPWTQCRVVQGAQVCTDGDAGSRGAVWIVMVTVGRLEARMSLRVGGQFHGLAGVGRKGKGRGRGGEAASGLQMLI